MMLLVWVILTLINRKWAARHLSTFNFCVFDFDSDEREIWQLLAAKHLSTFNNDTGIKRGVGHCVARCLRKGD